MGFGLLARRSVGVGIRYYMSLINVVVSKLVVNNVQHSYPSVCIVRYCDLHRDAVPPGLA